MLSEETYNELLEKKLSFLKSANKDIKDKILRHGALAKISKGTIVFDEGSECTTLAVVLSGKVRVFKLGESGKEITIYRILEGESCILTISSILSHLKFPATAVVEEDTEALVIPADVFQELVNKDEGWRNYTFGLVNKRLANIITVVEKVAFKRMDERIAEFLLKKFQSSPASINITHQEIADELGTHREVVSRILKEFEKYGYIKLSRNKIELLDKNKLNFKHKKVS